MHTDPLITQAPGTPEALPRHLVTGLVLAGGRASRMGGVDKGLQDHRGEPLARTTLERLRPQVGALMINVNRNRPTYESWGVPVCEDVLSGYAGPLAGFHAGLARCCTPLLVTVPCDTPRFPANLVVRLHAALDEQQADLAVAATLENGTLLWQPVFCLMRGHLQTSLAEFLGAGQARVERWQRQHRVAVVAFDEPEAFFNANTPEDLQRLQG